MENSNSNLGHRLGMGFFRRRDLLRGLFATGVFGAMFAHAPHAIASGGWFAPHKHGHGWRRWHRHGFEDLASAQRHVRSHLAHALDYVDATAEQHADAAAVVDRVVGDVFPLMQEHKQAHATFKSLLSAESIDRQALEAFRHQQADHWSMVSAKVRDGFADLAEILTAEQRRTLLDHWSVEG